jgi:hypothetical protein
MIIPSASVSVPRAALLIDADNFHEPDQLRAIHSQFGQHAGKGFVCHAHGDTKRLYEERLRSVWQELAVRLMPCLPLNKNTTDANLIVDALVLHFQLGVRRFAIASGDADFAPLALQLRELGCEVTCFARKSIAFEAMVGYYDRVVRFDVVPAAPEAEPKNLPVIPEPSVRDVSKPQQVAVSVTSAVTQPVPQPAVVQVARATGLVAASSDQNLKASEEIRKILAAVPDWRPHTVRQLNQLGSALSSGGIKKGNAPLFQLFRRHPSYFTVLPLSGAPRQVRLEKLP